ncbi:DUF5132 domain-containing protein [Aerosakkonemataceae cyanobacterium BLCC-F154]|uniref:DUF5132 domain-containing protein n=1 Tax=Floridaenema fluviatile BLCC-F154 TaxID=3153640 RepID=A0ABV4YD34_9CYAN
MDDILKGVALDEVIGSGGIPGAVVGIGALLLAPVLIPVVAGAGKPVAKAVIKEGIKFYEKGKESFAEVGEVFEDLIAEAKAELAEDETSSNNNQPQTIIVSD